MHPIIHFVTTMASPAKITRRCLRCVCTLLLATASLFAPSEGAVDLSSGCQASDVLWLWSGALSSHSITFKFGLRNGHSCSDRDFLLSAFPALLDGEKPHSALASCASVTVGGNADNTDVVDVMACEFDDLPHPDRLYKYELSTPRTGDIARSGSFRTPAAEGSPFSYRMAFASCADENSDPRVFTDMASHDPLFFMHTGDLHYHNLAVNNISLFRSAYDSIFASPSGKAMLEMQLPFAYMWDDHDYGPDNSDKTAPGRDVAVMAYREAVPHYPLAGESPLSPVHQAFTIGRVRFILTDQRSARTPNLEPDVPSKTVLGRQQKQWFKNELVRATQDPGIKLIIWCSTMPWHDDERKWGYFTHEQRELVNFIKGQGLNRWVPIIIVAGDAHMLAVDDGSHTPGNLTLLHAAALGRPGSIKGGPYSHGAYPGTGQYGLLDLTDNGVQGDGGRVCAYFRGINIYKGQLVEFDSCHPERTPSNWTYYPPPIPVRRLQRYYKKHKAQMWLLAAAIVAVIVYSGVAFVRCLRRRSSPKKHD